MNLDVIKAAPEALPLELQNRVNRELTAQLSLCEEQLDDRQRAINDVHKSLQFMKEHLGNVRAEIVNTQSLSESKRRELDSESNMSRIIERECGRLKQHLGQLRRTQDETQDHISTMQNRVFEGNLKMEELKSAMDFNQEELEQWDEARKQKEEDELAIAQYSKQDEAKIRHMSLNIEKHEIVVRDLQKQLDEELLTAQAVQNQLDQCAVEYRKLHDDRGGLLDEWEQVVRAIAERDNAIRVSAEQYADGMEWLMKRQAVKKDLTDQLDAVRQQTADLNYAISAAEKEAQQYRDAIPGLTRQVEEMDNEVEVLREQVARGVRDRKNLVARLQEREATLAKKKEELIAIQKRREAAAARLKDEIAAAEDLQQQSALIARLLSDAQKTDKNLDKDVEHLKQVQFRDDQQLHALREKQALLLSEISGAQSQGRNLNAKIQQLDSDSLQQQGVLYDIEFNVQQMEKKVSRAKGERTEDERKELLQKIDLLQTTLDELEKQHRVLDVQVKRVREELRQSKVATEKLDGSRKRAEELTLEIDLQCGHCEKDSKKLEREKEDELIKVDTMELQLNRLRRNLALRNTELVDLEDQRQQLKSDIAEREAEIAVHHNLLKMEAKLAEEERKRLSNELLDRQKNLSAIKNRHEVLVGRMDPAQARMSQAQLVVAAAKEREDLQFRGDSLDGRIKKVEKDILKLEKTISILKASNSDYKHKFDKITEHHEEVQAQRTLQEKYRELKAVMSRRALETNDYQATLVAKQSQLQQLAIERSHIGSTLQEIQQEYDQLSQEVLQTRESVIRYDQAINRARSVVDDSISKDVVLAENKERLMLSVDRLLACAQRAGDEVYDAVKQMVIESELPMPQEREVS